MTPATVLIIDSDADSITVYSTLLRHRGYQVIHALDGETGVRLAIERTPDIVVSDVFMPPLSRGDVVRQLRGDFRTVNTPVIVLDSAPHLFHELADRFPDLSRLTKPCEPSRLLQEIERLLDGTLPVVQ